MKFGYSYKTSDGARHEKVFIASSKEEVFETLRERGIRPIKVWSLEDDKMSPLMKTLVAFVVTLVVLAALIWLGVELHGRSAAPGPQEEDRSQIYGDPGILQTCEARAWSNVFENEGDRFLARFAQPGRNVKLSGQAWRDIVAADLKAHMKPVKVTRTDGPEIAKMKRMVNGMKKEMAQYVADGGTVEQYIDEVLERQKVEEGIVANFQVEFDRLAKKVTKENRDETVQKWNAKNVLLRQMGLRTVLLPEALEE